MRNPVDGNRATLLVMASLTLVGLGIRLSGPGRLYLDQFDEGIYALGGFWAFSSDGLAGLDPSMIPYAPPTFPNPGRAILHLFRRV